MSRRVSSSPSSVLLASNGGYPRSGDSSEEKILRRTLAGLERGERTAIDVLDAENVVTRFLIGEQARAGVEFLTDGHARWADPISHVAAKFEGIALGGERKLPGTEIPFRVPRVVGRIAKRPDGPQSFAAEYRFARNSLGLLPTAPGQAGKLSIKPVLVGPYTLARLAESDVPEWSSVHARAEAFAEVLAMEISALAAAGASLIQVDDPAILSLPQDWPTFQLAFARLAGARDAASQDGRKLQLALHVYGGSSLPLLDKLMQLPADLLGLDFSKDGEFPAPLDDRAICAGVVCGWSSVVEELETIKKRVGQLCAKASVKFIGPSTGMESLSPAVAFAKIRVLAEARQALGI